jgi:hypothetical protein
MPVSGSTTFHLGRPLLARSIIDTLTRQHECATPRLLYACSRPAFVTLVSDMTFVMMMDRR